MKGRTSGLALGILAVCAIGQGALQRGYIFNNWTKNFAPKGQNVNSASGLDPQQMLFALAGFREMIAGILWVRADAFFDSGNYDAILPIIRLVTILDPHQIDVFATGMWHIAYNFTDEEQRSDRRYIPSALALGKEGARQNSETYELYFETGWLWYHKIDDDYDNAVKWFFEAQKHPDMLPARKDLLPTAYQRDGKIDEAKDTYARLLKESKERFKKNPDEFSARQNRDTIENNLDTMLVRMVQRGYIAEKEGRSIEPYDVSPPFDTGFSVKATVLESRVILFQGTWNVLPVGTRIRVVLRDKNYSMNVDGKTVDLAEPAGMKWDFTNDVNLDPPRDLTFMQDQLFVRNRHFNRKVDMSKDPTMYPFKSKDYVLEFYYNPRSAPPHIQDKFSWNGEGMTDKNFLNTEVRKGQRVVFATMDISRDQVLRRGKWQDEVPVVKTKNYVETGPGSGSSDDVILQIPSLRSGGK